jgi:hypothetical protein
VIDPINNVVLDSPLKTWEAWPVNNPGPDRDDSTPAAEIPHVIEKLLILFAQSISM